MPSLIQISLPCPYLPLPCLPPPRPLLPCPFLPNPFPSPFLRNEPATLEIEDGTAGTPRAWRTEEVVGYECGFKNELVAFHDSIVTGRPPPTSGRDGLRDVTLCQAIIDSHHRSAPVDYPAGAGAGGAGAGAEGARAGAEGARAAAEGARAGAGGAGADAEGRAG